MAEDKFYLGYLAQEDRWQLFAADDPKYATPEASGYDDVSGPYDTREEAEEALADL
jgi:hypothetical protein